MKCANCQHHHAEKEPHVCTLLNCDKNCDENSFVPLTESDEITDETFQYYQSVIVKLNDIEERIRYMLDCIPGMRNTDDWQFINQYWHYYLGFCAGMPYTVQLYNKIHNEAQPDSITRMRRKICEPERTAIVILQDEIKNDKLTNKDRRYWLIQSEIDQLLKESKYLPTDRKLLKSKGIKEDATKEAVLLESS